MKCYLDSSVVLRYLLNGDQSLTKIKSFKAVGSSRLLQTECLRVIHRYRLENLIDDDQLVEVTRALDLILGGMQLFRVSDPVLARAGGPFPVVVGTLDAIHLATALLWDPQPVGHSLSTVTERPEWTRPNALLRWSGNPGNDLHPAHLR